MATQMRLLKGTAWCRECGRMPARVRLGHHTLCGVCWNKICWLKWAKKEVGGG